MGSQKSKGLTRESLSFDQFGLSRFQKFHSERGVTLASTFDFASDDARLCVCLRESRRFYLPEGLPRAALRLCSERR